MAQLIQIEEPEQQMDTSYPLAVGIDLGTTHCVVAVQKDPKVPAEVLPLYQGQPLVPSVVTYWKDRFIVGETVDLEGDAFEVRSSKRLLGSPAVYDSLKTDGEKLSPQDVASDLLVYLKDKTQSALGESIHQAVITVPAHFDEPARLAVRAAAKKANLRVLRLLHEPTAAALAYGLEKNFEGVYGVYDLGGGTFDFSVLRLTHGVFQVIGTSGIVSLGGDDFDSLLAEHLLQKGDGVNKGITDRHLNRSFMLYIRKLKEELSHSVSQKVDFEGGSINLQGDMTRQAYEALIEPLVHNSLMTMQKTLKEVGISPESLTGLIMVGGASRTPLIQDRLRQLYGNILLCDINPEEVVALGAAYQARTLLDGVGTLLLDVTPLSLGIETMGEIVEPIILRNSPLPSQKTCVYTTAHPDQEEILIHVLQGEGATVKECLSLGKIILKAKRISAEPRRIEVTFSLDADGLLSVEARDQHSDEKEQLTLNPIISPSSKALSEILKKM